MLGVPLMREGTPIGVLAMTRNQPRPFTPAQIELLTTFADQAVIAIETLRLFNEVQERTAETERTRQVMQTAFDNMDDGVALLDKDLRLQFQPEAQVAACRRMVIRPPAAISLFRRAWRLAHRDEQRSNARSSSLARMLTRRHPLRAARRRPPH